MRIIIALITIYQKCISPVLPRSCRFYPSCSQYMKEAVQKYGLLKGIALGMWRILRCNPLSAGGYDPVP
ncbi:MAG TPA: membrane protein insertion efficiency factor YidD [bacterium (Candidatus Stahlbacteria)]|nr:membrane protein insertion efficiency factor YidD [Candidatus Stahlbacteria bacterium]